LRYSQWILDTFSSLDKDAKNDWNRARNSEFINNQLSFCYSTGRVQNARGMAASTIDHARMQRRACTLHDAPHSRRTGTLPAQAAWMRAMWASVARTAAGGALQAYRVQCGLWRLAVDAAATDSRSGPSLLLLRRRELRGRRAALRLVAQVAGGACAVACVARATLAEPAASGCSPVAPRLQFQLVNILDYPAGADQAAELLATQWPSRGFSYRRQSLLTHCSSACHAERGALPVVLLLVDSDASHTVVAHCKVQGFPQPGSDGQRIAILVSCVVHAHYRNRGLGRLLVSHAEEMTAANGLTELYLWTLPEDGAKAFYTSCGFEQCQRPSYSPAYGRSLRTRQRNYPAAPHGAIWMRKSVVVER
jgi:GNAT superfamily N-acetyltransferase